MKINDGRFKVGDIGPKKGTFTPNEVITLEGDRLGLILTKGQIAIIDSADYEIVRGYRWTLLTTPQTFYVTGRFLAPDGRVRQQGMHRLLMNATVGQMIDHIDRRGWNNVRKNLRLCTHTQNTWNRSPDRDTASRFKGVCWNSNRWMVRIRVGGTSICLGMFLPTPEGELAAARTFDAAALVLRDDEFAAINFPGEKVDLDFIRLHRAKGHKPNGKHFETLVAPFYNTGGRPSTDNLVALIPAAPPAVGLVHDEVPDPVLGKNAGPAEPPASTDTGCM